MKNKKYYYITFMDCYDDSFGGSHTFLNNGYVPEDALFLYSNIIEKEEVSKEEYDNYWDEALEKEMEEDIYE